MRDVSYCECRPSSEVEKQDGRHALIEARARRSRAWFQHTLFAFYKRHCAVKLLSNFPHSFDVPWLRVVCSQFCREIFPSHVEDSRSAWIQEGRCGKSNYRGQDRRSVVACLLLLPGRIVASAFGRSSLITHNSRNQRTETNSTNDVDELIHRQTGRKEGRRAHITSLAV